MYQVILYHLYLSLQKKAQYLLIDPKPPANHRSTSDSPQECISESVMPLLCIFYYLLLLFSGIAPYFYARISLETAADLQLLFTSTAMPTLAI